MNPTKLFLQLLAVLAVVFCLVPHALGYYTATVDGVEWRYTVSDGQASLGEREWDSLMFQYNYITAISQETTGAIAIPSTLDGYPVTRIGDRAFRGCSGLTSVTIPTRVTSIGEWAFGDCIGLKSVTILGDVMNDWRHEYYDISFSFPPFVGCTKLETIVLGDNMTKIGNHMFESCSKISSIVIPDSVTSIGSSAFSGCSGMTSVTIPDSVTSIGVNAFQDCTGLTSVTILECVVTRLYLTSGLNVDVSGA